MFKTVKVVISILTGLISVLVVWASLSLTVYSDIDHVVLGATSERNGFLHKVFYQYLHFTDRIHDSRDYPVTLLQFTLNGYNRKNSNNEKILKVSDMLLSRGVNIDQKNRSGFTALHEQVVLNQPDLISFLLKRGANTGMRVEVGKEGSKRNLTPLDLAKWLQSNSRGDKNWKQVILLLENQSNNTLKFVPAKKTASTGLPSAAP